MLKVLAIRCILRDVDYAIYQGYDDVELRRLLAKVYWRASQRLSQMMALFLRMTQEVRIYDNNN
jgi:hypothetical protein